MKNTVIDNIDDIKACQSIVYRLIQYMHDNHLTQKDLAKKLDVSPQYINKLLHCKDTDLKITTALKYGRILGIELIHIPTAEPMPIRKPKEKYTDQFIPQMVELSIKYNVSELYVFGSVLTSRFKKSSDIDLAVRFNTELITDYADNFFEFKNELSTLLKREIDLIELNALQNRYFIEELNSKKQLIYAA